MLAGIAAIAVVLGSQLLASSSSGASMAPSASTVTSPLDIVRSKIRALRSEHRGPLGEADGAVPAARRSSTTRFRGWPTSIQRSWCPAPGRNRCRGRRGEFYVDSGWRSSAYQEQLLQEAVSKYGSEAEAARWVATPSTSAHVSGDAADIGRTDATAWLSEHGAAYGLCQIYDNERWHYELRPEAVDHGCPARYADPTHDPRMQQ